MVHKYSFSRSDAPRDLDLRSLTRICERVLIGTVGWGRPDWMGKIMARVEISMRTDPLEDYSPVYDFTLRHIPDGDKHPNDDPAKTDRSSRVYLSKCQMSTLEYGASGEVAISSDYRVECSVIFRNHYGESDWLEVDRIQKRYKERLENALTDNTTFIVLSAAPY